MSGYKEFEGKNLDDAIKSACTFFDAPREMLEVEIVSDAKGGIFGLVGARKAKIRARSVTISKVMESLEPSQSAAPKKNKEREAKAPSLTQPCTKERGSRTAADAQPVPPASPASREKTTQDKRPPKALRSPQQAQQPPVQTSAEQTPATDTPPQREARQDSKNAARGGNGRRSPKNTDRPRAGEAKSPQPSLNGKKNDLSLDADDLGAEDLPRIPLDQLDAATLQRVAEEVVTTLVAPLLDEFSCQVECHNDKLCVIINAEEEPGLLIGRDGQTLSSIQYLATRMISNTLHSLVRVTVDAGDYRERQDKRLRDLALSLAEKVKAGGRPQLTRPLTSYHRRVIHLTLQNDPAVQTHSKGEGELKRVVVTTRRKALEKDKQAE